MCGLKFNEIDIIFKNKKIKPLNEFAICNILNIKNKNNKYREQIQLRN